MLKYVENEATSFGIKWVYDTELQQLLTEMLTLMYTHSIIEPCVAK
jgi:hypothetical protein